MLLQWLNWSVIVGIDEGELYTGHPHFGGLGFPANLSKRLNVQNPNLAPAHLCNSDDGLVRHLDIDQEQLARSDFLLRPMPQERVELAEAHWPDTRGMFVWKADRTRK